MKFEVIDKKNGKVLDIDETSQMSIDTAGRLCGNDSLSGLYALDPLKYEVRFPEHEALKAELEKAKQKITICCDFYWRLIDAVKWGSVIDDVDVEKIARECGLEVK